MRDLKETFAHTIFLGAAKGARRDEERLWMIAEHLQEDETAVAFISLKTSNLLLTERRLVELRPHLDIQGFWNVLTFKGYAVKREVYLREVLGFHLDALEGKGSLGLQVGGEELVFAVPVAESTENPQEDLDAFGACLSRILKGASDLTV